MYMSNITFGNATFRDKTELQHIVEAKEVTLTLQYRKNVYTIYNDQSI